MANRYVDLLGVAGPAAGSLATGSLPAAVAVELSSLLTASVTASTADCPASRQGQIAFRTSSKACTRTARRVASTGRLPVPPRASTTGGRADNAGTFGMDGVSVAVATTLLDA